MPRAPARSLLIRAVVSAGFLTFGCNAILGNEERSLVESIGGGASGAAGTTAGSGGTVSGGSGGTAPDAGGSAGTAGGGEAGAAGAEPGGPDSGGATTSSSAAGGSAATTSPTATTTSTATTSSTATTTSTSAGGTGGMSNCECMPGASQSKQEACGNCGTATLTKLCGDDCRWGAFGAPGECMNQGVCAPNEAGEQLLHCERGRWRYSRSTCGSDCQWGTWTETACEGADVCEGCACIAWCTDPDTGGTTCKWIGCSEAEARAECLTDLTAPDVDCTLKEPFTFKEWLPD